MSNKFQVYLSLAFAKTSDCQEAGGVRGQAPATSTERCDAGSYSIGCDEAKNS